MNPLKTLIVFLIFLSSNVYAVVDYNTWTNLNMHDSNTPNHAMGYFYKKAGKPYTFVIIYRAYKKEKAYYGKGVDDYIALIGGRKYFGGSVTNMDIGKIVMMKIDKNDTDAYTNQESGNWSLISLNKQLIEKLKKGNVLRLAYELNDGGVKLDIPLKGFTKTHGHMLSLMPDSLKKFKMTQKDLIEAQDAKMLAADKLYDKELKALLIKISTDSITIIGPEAQRSLDYVKKINPEEIVKKSMIINKREITEFANNYVNFVGLTGERKKNHIKDIVKYIESKSVGIIEKTKKDTLDGKRRKR